MLERGWRAATRERFELREEGERDAGHALIGPVEVRNARAGQTLEVRIDEVRVGPWGVTDAGGWHTPLNERLGVAKGKVSYSSGSSMRTPVWVATRRGAKSLCGRSSA